MKALVEEKDAYVKAALFGIAIFTVAVLIILVAVIVVSPSDIAFPLFLLVPVVLASAALLFLRRWGLIIAGLLSLFGLFALTTDAGLTLTTPKAFFDFTLTLLALIGLGISLVACIVGTIQYFRGATPNEVSPPVNMVLRGLAGIAAVAVLVSLVLTVLNATDTVSAEDKQGAVELVAKDTKWKNNTLEASSGGTIRILAKNDDPVLHTFTLRDKGKGIDVDVKLGPWSEQIVEVGSLEPGTYGFICRVEGHAEDMTGVLTVR
jgi:uncharacterized cupredoxin-like copper-binding protein